MYRNLGFVDGRYGILDTEDGDVSWVTERELLSTGEAILGYEPIVKVVDIGCLRDKLYYEGYALHLATVLPSVEDDLEELEAACHNMFSEDDVPGSSYYTCFAPLVVSAGVMDLQGGGLFNPEGAMRLVDVLYGISRIGVGVVLEDANSNEFFDAGYRMLDNKFRGIYTRSELFEPITRLEFAYLVVVLWGDFYKLAQFPVGITFDWLSWSGQSNYLDRYEVCTLSDGIIDFDVREFRGGLKMSEYMMLLSSGERAIPLAMMLSLIELVRLGVFSIGSKLIPFEQLSRAEFCYSICRLTQIISGRRKLT